MEILAPIRFAIIGVAAVASAAIAAPEPAKPAAESSSPTDHSTTILASADHTRSPNQPAEASRKPRAMRVTTCRCGDQPAEQADEPKDD